MGERAGPRETGILRHTGDEAARTTEREAILLPDTNQVATIAWIGRDPRLDFGIDIILLFFEELDGATREWAYRRRACDKGRALGWRRAHGECCEGAHTEDQQTARLSRRDRHAVPLLDPRY